jgi:hypothetical protein
MPSSVLSTQIGLWYCPDLHERQSRNESSFSEICEPCHAYTFLAHPCMPNVDIEAAVNSDYSSATV